MADRLKLRKGHTAPSPEAMASNKLVASADHQTMQRIPPLAVDTTVTPFLERLPEIRNLIYEALFQTSEPKVLFYKLPVPEGKKMELRHPINGIALLYTCRQIYEEAASILYGKSSFMALSCEGMDCEFLLEEIQLFLPAVHDWLAKIGDKRGLLQCFRVDLTLLVLSYDAVAGIDITALVRFMFGNLKSEQVPVIFSVEEEFVHKGHKAAVNVAALNSVLSRVPKFTMLRTLLRCWRRVMQLRISRKADLIYLFMDLPGIDKYLKLEFMTSSNGSLYQCRPPAYPTLTGIFCSQKIGKKILTYLDQVEKSVSFDLNQHMVSHPWPEIFQVNKRLRREAFAALRSRNITLKLVVKNRDASNTAFDALKFTDWFLHSAGPSHIVLAVDAGDAIGIDDIRLNAVQLCAATHRLYWDDEYDLKTHLTGDGSSLGVPEPLNSIKLRLFCFLARILRKYPDLVRATCPIIWLDGHCRIREAEYETPRVIVRNEEWASEEELKMEQANSYIRSVKKMFVARSVTTEQRLVVPCRSDRNSSAGAIPWFGPN